MARGRNHLKAASATPPMLEDRSYLAYLRPTPRPFLHFASGHFPPATRTMPHSHPCIALHGCIQGPLTLCMPREEVVLEPGIFYLIGPGLPHSWRNEGRHVAATLSLLLDTGRPGRWPSGVGVEAACQALHRRVTAWHRFTTSGDQELHHSFWLAADHLTAEESRETITLTGVLLELLGQMQERLLGAKYAPGGQHGMAQEIRRLLLARVREQLS